MLEATTYMKELYRPFVAEDHEFHPFHKFCYLKEEAISTRLTSVLGIAGWSKIIEQRQEIPAGVPVVKFGKDNKTEVLLSNYPGKVVAREGRYYEVLQGTRKVNKAVLDDKGIPVKDGDKVRMEQVEEDYDDEVELSVVFDVPCVLVHGYMSIRDPQTGAEAIRYTTGGDVLTSLGKEYNNQLMNTYKSADTDFLKRGARMFGVGLYITELPKKDKIESVEALEKWLEREYGVKPVSVAKREVASDLYEWYPDPKDLAPIVRRLDITNDDFSFRTAKVIEAIKAAA
jgi:hypothetical protein